MGKHEDIEHYAWILRSIGERILVNTCSSALFVMCKSPIYRRSKIYFKSLDDMKFIEEGGIKRLAEVYNLDVEPETFLELFYDKVAYIKDQYYVQNSSI